MVSYRCAQKWAIWTAYILHLLILPSLIGLIINFHKSKQYRGIEYEDDSEETIPVGLFLNHHLWLMRSFNVLLVLVIVSFASVNFGIGLYAISGAGVWWLYRVTRGMLYLCFNKSMPILETRKAAVAAA